MNDNSYSGKENVLVDKSYDFSLGIIALYKKLASKNEYVLSKQIIRSGTSIGANINEAQSAQSKKDFIHKLSISLKEARETSYWLRLLRDSDFINVTDFKDLFDKYNELLRLLTSVILTTKKKYGL